MDEEPKYPITIFYDGACGICRREMENYRTKDKNTRLKFINANHPNFDPKSEGLDPIKILDYIYAKDQNGKVVYGVDAFAWIWEACGYKFLPILVRLPLIRELARAFYRLFARYRYEISREKLVCGPECDHKMI
jgi:predicted DCC family thiol-disulfide oxidoreductase YuxK